MKRFILLLGVLSSCGTKSSDESSSEGLADNGKDSFSDPEDKTKFPPMMLKGDYTANNHSNLIFKDEDTNKELTEAEMANKNMVLVCIRNDRGLGVICKSSCVSNYFPKYERYALLNTNYLTDNTCEMYLFGSTSPTGKNRVERWKGVYTPIKSGSVAPGNCIFSDEKKADFLGYGEAKTERHEMDRQAIQDFLILNDKDGAEVEKRSIKDGLPYQFSYLEGEVNKFYGLTFDCKRREQYTTKFLEGIEL